MLLQVFVLVGVSSLTFFMMIVMPGDPSTILMDTTGGISTDAVAKFRERWGFDKPAYMQYITFMSNLVRGDFGESFVTRKEIQNE
jgi:ABC-type dipeptide/oligopeptide/nickel transport system permease component